MWYVYFLLLANGDVYVGSSNDLRRRITSHQDGKVASTKAYLPVKRLSYVAVGDEALARGLERYFKTGSGKAVASKRFWRRDLAQRSANAPVAVMAQDGGAFSEAFGELG